MRRDGPLPPLVLQSVPCHECGRRHRHAVKCPYNYVRAGACGTDHARPDSAGYCVRCGARIAE